MFTRILHECFLEQIIPCKSLILLNNITESDREICQEFGNFWNVANKKKICPSKILGKLVGTDFNEKDWNKFFNYGFYCIQKYLRQGLVQQSLNSYMRKNLVSVIEGVEGNGEVLDWMEEWISTTRIENNYHIFHYGFPNLD